MRRRHRRRRVSGSGSSSRPDAVDTELSGEVVPKRNFVHETPASTTGGGMGSTCGCEYLTNSKTRRYGGLAKATSRQEHHRTSRIALLRALCCCRGGGFYQKGSALFGGEAAVGGEVLCLASKRAC